MSERLREMVAAAEHGRQDTTDVVVRAAQSAVARERLAALAPEMAALLADTLDGVTGELNDAVDEYGAGVITEPLARLRERLLARLSELIPDESPA